jgi:hypothetical protein
MLRNRIHRNAKTEDLGAHVEQKAHQLRKAQDFATYWPANKLSDVGERLCPGARF